MKKGLRFAVIALLPVFLHAGCASVDANRRDEIGIEVASANAIRVTSTTVGLLRPGQSETITWTVTGTTKPVRLRIVNPDPGAGVLQGGHTQIVTTSGGSPNRVSRTITGLTPGSFGITVSIEQSVDPEQIAAALQRAVSTLAAQTKDAADQLPVTQEESPPRRTVRTADVYDILENVDTSLRTALPFPELAAFQDAAAMFLEEIRSEATSAPQVASGGIVLVVARSRIEGRIDESRARRLIDRLLRWLDRLGNSSPLGTICIVTTPRDGASVVLYPPSFPSDTHAVTSSSRLTLYLGRYVYEISRRGFESTKNVVDLLLNPARVLVCPLSRNPGDLPPCRLLAEPVERYCK